MNILLVIMGAFLWRIRGGLLNSITGKENWHGFNDTVVRMLWSCGMAALFWLAHPSAPWLGHHFLAGIWAANGLHGFSAWCGGYTLLALALFAGTTVIGWMHAELYPKSWRDIWLLSLSGSLRMAFVAVALLSPWPLIAGALCGPIYWVGSRIPQKPGSWQFWQEWLFGALVGASLAVSS